MIDFIIDFINNTLGCTVLDFTCLCIISWFFYKTFISLFLKLVKGVK